MVSFVYMAASSSLLREPHCSYAEECSPTPPHLPPGPSKSPWTWAGPGRNSHQGLPQPTGVGGGSLGIMERGRANQLAPLPPAPWPGLSKLVWQAAEPGVGAVTDRLVIGKLPSLAQECCLVTMVTFTTSGLTKAQGICYLKPLPPRSPGLQEPHLPVAGSL